jgi:superfamily II DNA/RNA helicase
MSNFGRKETTYERPYKREGYERNKYRNNDRNDKYDKSKFKPIEVEEDKFNYVTNSTDLFEKDDIKCSEDIIEDVCESFDEIGGEEGLKEDLLRGIFAYGYDKPSRIQSYAIPQIIKKRDILAQSQSGTGKTGAFIISILQNIDENIKEPQAIILSPTCELARQTYVVGKALSQFMTNINFSFTVGGSDRSINIKELGGVYQGKTDDNIAQIIIATPGRLIDIITQYPHLFQKIRYLVIDECDELLSGTFRDEIKKILIEFKENDLQISLFSATLTNDVILLSNHILKNPAKILIKQEKLTLDGIKQTFIAVNRPDDKMNVLLDMLSTISVQQFIIYVNSKKNAELLQNFLEGENYSVLVINSSMPKYERATTLTEFKEGGIKCLISTDLLSRGIDIQQLSLVINYDLPNQNNLQCYVHRIGRTGRFGRQGLSINLVTKYEKDIQNLISMRFKCEIVPFNEEYVNNI